MRVSKEHLRQVPSRVGAVTLGWGGGEGAVFGPSPTS